jgi:hypothetical protein
MASAWERAGCQGQGFARTLPPTGPTSSRGGKIPGGVTPGRPPPLRDAKRYSRARRIAQNGHSRRRGSRRRHLGVPAFCHPRGGGGPGGGTCGYPPLSPPRRRGSRRSHLWAPASPFGDPLRDAKRDAKRDSRARQIALNGHPQRRGPSRGTWGCPPFVTPAEAGVQAESRLGARLPLRDAKRDAKRDEARYAGATVSCRSQPTD